MGSRARLLGLLLTAVFLVLAVRGIDPAELADQLRRVNYLWIVPSAICTALGYVLRTVRWRTILSGNARAPLGVLFGILMMGFATNNLLPGRLGELWRAYLLGRRRNVRKTFALASVFVERIFDGLVLVAVLEVISTSVALPGWGQQVQLVSAIVFVLATVVVALLVWAPNIARSPVVFVSSAAPQRISIWVLGSFDAFVDGLRVLRRPSVLIQASVASLGIWALEGGSYFFLSQGLDLGLSTAARIPAMALTLVSINLGIMVPSAPGYVGTQEFFGTSALAVFHVTAESALALVLISHAMQYALVTSTGLIFFAREHLSPTDLKRVQARGEAQSQSQSLRGSEVDAPA